MTLKIDLQIKKVTFELKLNLSLPIEAPTILTGNSGSGKTTLLRCIAGLEKANGIIKFGKHIWQDSKNKINIPTHKRGVGYIFQHANLFSHLTVQENLEYGFKRAKQKLSFQEIVDLFKLKLLLLRYPHNLSGGEKQLVALARSLLAAPQLLLMDEPVSSLDRKCKQNVLCVIKDIQNTLKTPMIYVTHCSHEAKKIGSNIINIKNGCIL